MCMPSWSASDRMITLWNFRSSMRKSLPYPAPSAEMMVRISSLASTWSMRFFSTFSGLPRRGRMACVCRTRACLAVPPAESPSTMNSSFSSGFLPVHADELAHEGQAVDGVFGAGHLLGLPRRDAHARRRPAPF